MNTSTLSSNTLGHSTGQRTSESQDSELTSSGSHTCKILNQIKSELQEQKQQKRLLKELHLKRVQSLRKELEYLKATEWKYQPIDRSELQKLKMLSAIYTFINNILTHRHSPEPVEEDINDIISKIENIGNTNSPFTENEENYDEENHDEKGSYYKTGIVTSINDDYILVNNHSICDIINIQTGKPKVGDTVYYLAYKKSEDHEEKICKIISVMEESWDDEVIKPQETNIVKTDMFTRNIIGKVIKRKGRILFIDSNKIYFDLNKINSEFVPIVGDWLKLEALVEVNDNKTDFTGEILEINKIQPLRFKLDIDNITDYDPIKGYGTIANNILFHKNVCESGYVPYVGDKVISDSIESDQNKYSWRSLSVAPLMQVSDKSNELVTSKALQSMLPQNINLDRLIKDKCGIIITDDIKVNVNLEEEKDIYIEIQNTSHDNHILYKGTTMLGISISQLSLVSPLKKKLIDLKPFDTITYQFRCNPKFVGSSEELLLFFFKGFQIGRICKITVNPKNIINAQKQQVYKKDNYVQQRDQNDQATTIPGIRPYKPPISFNNRTKVFKVPEHFWEVVLNNYRKSLTEYELAVENEIIILAQRLSFQIYTDRFHALLYLEEIQQTINISQYNIENAVMKHSKDYLCLEVLGLSEKRPSLIIGDKAIISLKWDIYKGKIKYEGYIHKVTSTEIFLKFNRQFHEEYKNEICDVTFKTSTSVMNRCHNAVDFAALRLGSDFLFPTNIIEKDPQIILDEVDDKEEKETPIKRKLKRNESISSISSSTTSDSSSTTKSLPKISVAERLFKVKPIEQTKNITKNTNLATVDGTDNNDKSVNDFKNNKSIDVNKDECKNKDIPDLSTTSNPSNTSNDSTLNKCISQIKKRKLKWFNENLNYHQKEAIKNILKGVARPLPYVIFGPPGTGKSVTLCETILQLLTILPESRLLVATPSNSSANLILERLLDSKALKPGDVVRLVAHHCVEDGTIPQKLFPYCATADISEGPRVKLEPDFQEFKIKCAPTVIGRHRITIATCTALGTLFNIKYPRNHFSHVLIDEAGQATEPEIMIPLSFIHADHGQVILAGDPLQLGPVVQSNLAKHFGLEESFLSRLLRQFPYQRDPEGFETGYDPRLVTKLVMNYRSLPEILELPNSLFYNSELQPKISCKNSNEANLLQLLADELPQREGLPPAIVFHGVKGENLRDNDSPSWYNPEEATQIYLYLLRFYKYGVSADDIGIITPYQKQVLQIRQLLSESNVICPKVSSVEGFQGQERKIIILSTVRSSTNFIKEDIKHALGFVASPKRLNVAITRARALLIILGNPELLVEDPYWRSVLVYCNDRNNYTGCALFPFHLNNSFNMDNNLDTI